jgi:hypothetical protein
MSDTATGQKPPPFRATSPGDLITADLVNGIQVDTREEIAREIRKAVAGVTEVDRARDAAKLEGKTLKELIDEIVRLALQAVPQQTRYRCVYKRIQHGEPAVIRHGLNAAPLVDVYELRDFEVVASADRMETVERVLWYLYHRTELKIRRPRESGRWPGQGELVTIEESRGPVFKLPFHEQLKLHDVPYNEQSTLGDVINEFWKKLFSDPNDLFDETAYANSPWCDRCCGDRRTVESLKRGGEWNDLFLKVVPVKGVNPPFPLAPPGVLVEHYDLDSLGLWWLPTAEPDAQRARDRLFSIDPGVAERLRDRFGGVVRPEGAELEPPPEEIRVMVLLKV